jgi:protein involved in polysaccharide export with SLBB domain
MNRLFLLLSLVLALRLAAAEAPAPAAPGTNAPPAVAAPDTGTNSPAKTTKEGSSGSVVDATTRELKPHDILRYQILEDPPLPNSSDQNRVAVSDAGEALFPVSRYGNTYVKVTAAGRKLEDIRKDLKAALDADYYMDCTVTLDLEQVTRPTNFGDVAKVTIYGTLNQVIQIGDGETLMLSDAILRAGGAQTGTFADLRRVVIHRADPASKRELTITVNVEKVLKGARSDDKELMDGDRIEVRDKTFIF